MSLRFAKPTKATPEERKAARKAKARARRKSKPPGVKWLTHLADDLHSIRIRACRSGCEVAAGAYPAESCLGREVHPSQLQLAHGFTRRDKGTRYDPSNTFAACPQCHRKHTPSGAAWYSWMEERLGSAVFYEVKERASAFTKHTPEMLLEVCRQSLDEIHGLPQGIRREWAEERVLALTPRLKKAGLAQMNVVGGFRFLLTPATEEEQS